MYDKNLLEVYIDRYLTNTKFDRICYLTSIVTPDCNNCTFCGSCSKFRLVYML